MGNTFNFLSDHWHSRWDCPSDAQRQRR